MKTEKQKSALLTEVRSQMAKEQPGNEQKRQ